MHRRDILVAKHEPVIASAGLLAIAISYGLTKSIMRPLRALIAAKEKMIAGASLDLVELHGAPPEIAVLGNTFAGNYWPASILAVINPTLSTPAACDLSITCGDVGERQLRVALYEHHLFSPRGEDIAQAVFRCPGNSHCPG